MIRTLLALLLMLVPGPALAQWKEASSKHFLVYGEGSADTLRDTAAELEKFHFLLRSASGRSKVTEPPRIKIYIMPGMSAVTDTMAVKMEGVAGYYTADVRGPIALTLRTGTGAGSFGELKPQEVLFHELTHHFMMQYFPGTYPAWYVEGFADYYGTTRIKDGDLVEIGHPVLNRYFTLRNNVGWMPVETLLSAKNYDDVKSNLEALYAEGWLLVHYLANSKERFSQLDVYLNAVARGEPYGAAAKKAFGNLNKLNSELIAYSRRSSLPVLTVKLNGAEAGSIDVRNLSAAENALITHDIRLSSGILKTDAARFADRLAGVAARYPNDPYALRLVTEAHRLAGNTQAASAAADRWVAARPDDPLAMAFRGLLQTDALRASKSGDKAAWEAARQLILAAHRKAPRNPQILKAFYDSYAAEGVSPPAGAQNALVTAHEIVPQDDKLRYQVASDYEKRGFIEDAINVIRPAAFASAEENESAAKKAKREKKDERERLAGDDRTESAREMLARLEQKLAAQKKGG